MDRGGAVMLLEWAAVLLAAAVAAIQPSFAPTRG